MLTEDSKKKQTEGASRFCTTLNLKRAIRCASCGRCRTNIGTFIIANELVCRLCIVAAMMERQNKRCAICKLRLDLLQSDKIGRTRITIDHCHETGKVRGLLCGCCNVGLGQFRDNKKSLKNAVRYLKMADDEDLGLRRKL